jgi:simple sugar transport system permease protein
LVLLFAYFSILEPSFFTIKNVFAIIRTSSLLGMLSLSYTILVIVGEFDMSFTASAAFSSVIIAILIGKAGLSLWLAFLCGFLISIIISSVNAFITLNIKMPSFLATLGMKGILDGTARWLTGGATYFYPYWPKGFLFARLYLFGIPVPAITFMIFAVVLAVLLEYTKLGRHFYAVGGSPSASNHSGIDVKKNKLKAFIMGGLFCSITGIVGVSLLGSAATQVYDKFLLMGITACFMGAIFLKDGVPNIWGTVVASLILGVLSNGFVFLNISQGAQEIIQGITLVGSILIVILMRKSLRVLNLPVRV